MPVPDSKTDELRQYLEAREALMSLQTQLDEPTMWHDVLNPRKIARDRLNDVVASLCHQARAAQQLASAAEHLCAALVCGGHNSVQEDLRSVG